MRKIPKFKTDEEAARFWETHSFQDYYKETKEAGIKFISLTDLEEHFKEIL